MRKVVLALLAIPSIFLGGCWDESQYKDVTIVPVMGITTSGGQVKEFFSYPTFHNDTISYTQSEGSGISGRSAREDANHRTMEALDFTHLEVLLVSSEIAKNELHEQLDMFFRSPRNRITSYLAIVEGDMEQYFKPPGDLNTEVADFYPELLRTAVLYSYITENTMGESVKILLDDTIDLSLPYLTINDNGIPTIEGIALFSHGKYTGATLKKQEAVLAGVMKKQQGKYTRLSFHWKERDSPITIEIINTRRKMKISNDRISVNYVINFSVVEFPNNNLNSKNIRRETENFLSAEIKKDFDKIIKKTQENKSDIIGFGRTVHAFHQKMWNKGDWSETYSTLPIEVNVTMKMKRTSIYD
ncbi:Ger(x)C family spore germination protein [Sporosarcina highlanderae]|uniref:Ger(X)C family spore germination protein n=1 Tax=Sporosarcina highlanderae TaxID=3035916 RepID=A0ABT8JSX8_9BACL|nr:Ger(x)C family spore germination protein [Sporosarcina highlanderae]MDN4607636.1 Ger(x)C family spore germination protein [Sporosarcina highlanderae]